MTGLSAFEIFTNPGDLEFTIVEDTESGKFSIGIFRGSGHNYKPLITSRLFAESIEVAAEQIRELLETASTYVRKEFDDRKSLPSRLLNPDGRAIDETKVLNPELIGRIIAEVKQNRSASTCQMMSVPSS